MDEYINKNKLKEKILARTSLHPTELSVKVFDDELIELIDNLQKEDVKPIKRFKWECSKNIRGYKYCSNCKNCYIPEDYLQDEFKWHYCPNCGAMIDGE